MDIDVQYQKLPDVPLNLSKSEVSDLISFLESLTDYEKFNKLPKSLPEFEGNENWNKRKIGGNY